MTQSYVTSMQPDHYHSRLPIPIIHVFLASEAGPVQPYMKCVLGQACHALTHTPAACEVCVQELNTDSVRFGVRG